MEPMELEEVLATASPERRTQFARECALRALRIHAANALRAAGLTQHADRLGSQSDDCDLAEAAWTASAIWAMWDTSHAPVSAWDAAGAAAGAAWDAASAAAEAAESAAWATWAASAAQDAAWHSAEDAAGAAAEREWQEARLRELLPR